MSQKMMTTMMIVVLILNLGVGILLLTTKIELAHTVSCQAQYNQQFSLAYRARASAGGKRQKALDRVMFFVFENQQLQKPSADEQQKLAMRFQKILARYVKTEKNFNGQPLPPLPNQFCDGTG